MESGRAGRLAGNVETLVVGSSHGDHGFDPSKFPNSYNACLTSGDLRTSFEVTQALLDRLSSLKTVVVFLSFFSVGYDLTKTRERNRSVYYAEFFKTPFPSELHISNKTMKAIKLRCQIATKSPSLHLRLDGYSEAKSFMDASATERAETHLRENGRQNDQLHWLESLSRMLKDRDISLHGVLPPYRKDYVSAIGGATAALMTWETVARNINIIDLTTSSIVSDSDFGDPDHLNSMGAGKVSMYLHDRINGA